MVLGDLGSMVQAYLQDVSRRMEAPRKVNISDGVRMELKYLFYQEIAMKVEKYKILLQ